MINIGHSTIYGLTGENSSLRGPIGATGQTGADQTVGGPTGPTGVNSNYVQEILVNNSTGEVTLVFSDDTINYNAGIIKGATGVYAGITALSVGNNIPLLKGVCGGVTLEFYNFSPDGLVGITVDTDGSLKFFVNANSIAGSVDSNIEPNKIVYAVQKNQITSTLLDVIQKTETAKQTGNTAYGYVNFGLTGGRSVVGDVQETLLTVGPIERGNKVITVDEFYTSGSSGITLDLSYSSVYKIVTPIGIKAFTTDNAPISDGQICSVTLIVEGDDVWNFPENVIFDDSSKAIFYPGTNILHLWKSNLSIDSKWKAHFSARGFGVNRVTNPGVVGSCCYLDADGTKNCKEYVTEDYCNQQIDGIFSGLVPCNLNPCIIAGMPGYDGVCCSEGRCISDIDPSLCATIGGYFINGITCGDVGVFPDNDADNNTGLCYNRCKAPTVCCKDGNCLGNLTKPHCEEILGGKIVEGQDCGSVNCCDLISARGACCIPQQDGTYSCEYADTPYECKTTKGGYYMGINSVCSESICCNVPIDTCYECIQTSSTCSCNPIDIYSGTCSSNNLLEDCTNCQVKSCHKCDCQTGGCVEVEVCQTCPSGYVSGPCNSTSCTSPSTKTCYAPCGNSTQCRSQIANLNPGYDCRTCQELASQGAVGVEYINDACTDCPCTQLEKTCYGECDPTTQICPSTTVILGDDPGEIVNCNSTCSQLATAGYVPADHVNDECSCKSYVACFWCYPNITGANNFVPGESTLLGGSDQESANNWKEMAIKRGYAPYRALHIVPEPIYQQLEAETVGVTYTWEFNGSSYAMGPMRLPLTPQPYEKGKGYHYIESGGCLARDQGLDPVSNLIAPMGVPFDDCGLFYCTYLNSYVYSPGNPGLNRERCLDRFGYDDAIGQIARLTCKLCDPIGQSFRFEHPLQSTTYQVSKTEKYQELLEAGIHAPFPPIWGRLSMWNIAQACDVGTIKEATNNLALLDPLLSLDMAKTFAGKLDPLSPVGASKGYLWWHKYTMAPNDGIPYDPNDPSGVVKYNRNATYSLYYQVGTLGNKCTVCTDGDERGEKCTCGPNDNLGECSNPATDFIPWDPYRMGGNAIYCAARGAYPIAKYFLGATPQCDLYNFAIPEGWAHYNVPLKPIFGETIGNVTDPTGNFNWFDNAELHYKRIQGTDLRLRCPDDPSYSGPDRLSTSDGVPRGILGRNLRYNLAEFNTGTVFYNPDGSPTMFVGGFGGFQHNPPIFKWQIWNTGVGGDGAPCTNPDLPGASDQCAPCCVPDPSADPPVCCAPCDPYEFNACGTTIKGCGGATVPCDKLCNCDPDCTGYFCVTYCCSIPVETCTSVGDCSGPHCDPGSNSGGGQLNILTGNEFGSDFTPIVNYKGEDITKTQNQYILTSTEQAQTKNVQIAPGLCVNMLCPECNSYESC